MPSKVDVWIDGIVGFIHLKCQATQTSEVMWCYALLICNARQRKLLKWSGNRLYLFAKLGKADIWSDGILIFYTFAMPGKANSRSDRILGVNHLHCQETQTSEVMGCYRLFTCNARQRRHMKWWASRISSFAMPGTADIWRVGILLYIHLQYPATQASEVMGY